MVGVAPRARTRGSISDSPATVRSRPRARDMRKALVATPSASSFRRAPRSRAVQLPAPIPTVKPTAWMMAISENTTPTAPAALVPSLETK